MKPSRPFNIGSKSSETGVFWTDERLNAIASLPCWDIVLTLMDGLARTASEIGVITGRTPGALHLPLEKLHEAEIIEYRVRQIDGKGRPGREYLLKPQAMERPCSNGRVYEDAVQKATTAGLRLIMRNSARLADENATRFEEGVKPRTSARWLQFSNLLPQDVEWVEAQLMGIMDRLAERRTEKKGQRYRIAMMLVPDEFDK